MRAAVLHGTHRPVVIEDVELAPPKRQEVKVRLAASGVCGSDLHRWLGDIQSVVPMVMGHEGAGVVAEVGEDVVSVQPGDHVVLSWTPGCGHCRYCYSGRYGLCQVQNAYRAQCVLLDGTSRLSLKGQPVGHQSFVSSMAEYTVVHERSAIKVNPAAPLDKIALVGCGVPTGVGAAMNTARVQAGSTVAVFGCGGVGLNTIQGAALCGAEKIIAIDIADDKLEFAQTFGATHGINAQRQDTVKAIRDIVPDGVDYAFEVISTPKTIVQAIESVCPGGKVVVVGVVAAGEKLVMDWSVMRGEKVLMTSSYGSIVPQVDIPRIVDLYLAGKLKIDELVQRRLPLEGINEALAALQKGGLARTLLYPD